MTPSQPSKSQYSSRIAAQAFFSSSRARIASCSRLSFPTPPAPSSRTTPRVWVVTQPGMAYVDHAFSISDEDDLVGGAIGGPRGAPVKEIAFAAALLAFGALGVIGGLLMAANRVGGDRAHGIFFMILGIVMFIPGFYYTRIAYYAYKGYKGFSFSNIPPI